MQPLPRPASRHQPLADITPVILADTPYRYSATGNHQPLADITPVILADTPLAAGNRRPLADITPFIQANSPYTQPLATASHWQT